MQVTDMQIVWFKRDLRVVDHSPLTMASNLGPILPVYVLEPELWKQPDLSLRQYEFLNECIDDLAQALRERGQNLIIKVGECIQIFSELTEKYTVDGIWTYQETWNGWTYARDKRFRRWLQEKDIPFHELPRNGVIRRLKNRDGWSGKWHREMDKPLVTATGSSVSGDEESDAMPLGKLLGLTNDCCVGRQAGGRGPALEILNSFLSKRGQGYTKEMSSPVTAFNSCSRLSPHLAFGTVSIREVYQMTKSQSSGIKLQPKSIRGKWPSALKSFSSRLRWHSHFIQKLEDDPRIEFENMHAGYNGLRENNFNEEYFKAWAEGRTGYPMVDACMRALSATGWINFRMRAMLVSFASYHLWLHWREPALYLARLFTDYEPGIHYSQIQMQSGTTGINSVRIYNPIKQGIDHDPSGVFIKKWVPELKDMELRNLHTPWLSIEKIGDYPLPIVDEKTGRSLAIKKIYDVRKGASHRARSTHVLKQHGSRRLAKKRSPKKSKKDPISGSLF